MRVRIPILALLLAASFVAFAAFADGVLADEIPRRPAKYGFTWDSGPGRHNIGPLPARTPEAKPFRDAAAKPLSDPAAKQSRDAQAQADLAADVDDVHLRTQARRELERIERSRRWRDVERVERPTPGQARINPRSTAVERQVDQWEQRQLRRIDGVDPLGGKPSLSRDIERARQRYDVRRRADRARGDPGRGLRRAGRAGDRR
jgi:hypothetical protein